MLAPQTPAYDEAKFAELLLYAAGRLEDDPAGGATKLNKVLYFAEFAHLRLTGRPISGAEYQKLANGPAPRRLLPVRDRLVREGAAELRTDVFQGYELDRLVPLRPPCALAASERRAVDAAVAAVAGKTSVETSELSHDEPGWRWADLGETIPYETAFLDPDQQRSTPAIRRRAAEIARRYGIAPSA